MDTDELIGLLHDLASGDLADDSNIDDHPCSLAIVTITALQDQLEVAVDPHHTDCTVDPCVCGLAELMQPTKGEG